MKKLYIILIVITFTISTNAQVKTFDIEISAGTTRDFHKGSTFGPVLALDFRYNPNNTFLSPGIQLRAGTFDQRSTPPSTDKDSHSITGLVTYCDYNFKPMGKISPFIGLGTDVAGYVEDGFNNANLSIRAGIGFFKHFKISMDYIIEKHEHDCFTLRIGYVFGAGKKK